MSTKTLVLRTISRTLAPGLQENVRFETGVNVLVGRPNTGKSSWLTMIDYLLGDTETARKALGTLLSEKYDSIHATVEIGGAEHTIERRWKEQSLKSKILLDGEPLDPAEFSSYLLELLAIPEVHYPKGDPYSPRTWPTLSWKQLSRHIYRRQYSWSDIADKQYDDDQHACLTLFLGVAELLYSEHYSRFVELNKRKIVLEQSKDQYSLLFADLYRYLSGDQTTVDPTLESIDLEISRISTRIRELDVQKSQLKDEMWSEVTSRSNSPYISELGEQWESLQTQRSEVMDQITKANERFAELAVYRQTVVEELSKFSRTRRAVERLVDLQVTNCPVCDQTVQSGAKNPGHCFLCSQPLDSRDANSAAGEERIRFEVAQLEGEKGEVDELVEVVRREGERLTRDLTEIDNTLVRIQAQLSEERRAIASILPSSLGRFEAEEGALNERQLLFERMRLILGQRDRRSTHIDELEKQLETLRNQMQMSVDSLDLEQKSDLLSNEMNNYLSMLNREIPGTWSQGRVAVRVGRSRFSIEVDGEPWRSKLGATLRLYLLLSYHYALLTLSNKSPFHYPGLVILDFPGEIAPGETISDKENFVLNPFVSLLRRESMANTQVIAAGAAFEGLDGARRQSLDTVWA